MTASNTKGKLEEKTTKKINSIHIVVFACPNCGDEIEELKLCKECKNPMKVIQVIEKFGTEADEYLAKLKKEGVWDDNAVRPKHDEPHDTGVSISEDELDDIDIKVAGEDEPEEVDALALGDIFPDDGDQAKPPSNEEDLDWAEALEKLDEEEDTTDLKDELPEL